MRYFELIRSGIDVAPLLEEINSQEQAWLLNTSRQDKIRVQRDTNTIFICAPVARPDLNVNENQESTLTAVSELFPRAVAFMTGVAKEMNAQLSRATIVRLKRKSFFIDPTVMRRAKKALGAPTDATAVRTALERVAENEDFLRFMKRTAGKLKVGSFEKP